MSALASDAIVLEAPAAPAAAPGAAPAPQSWLKRPAALRRPLAAMLDQAMVSAASFTAVVLIGRVAGERQLGLYSLAATLVVLAAGVQESLVIIPYTVFAPRAGDERRRQIAASALAQSGLVSLLLMTGLAATVGAMTLAMLTPRLAVVLAVLSAVAPAVLLRDFARRVALAGFHVGQALKIDGAATLLQVTLLAGLALGGGLSAASGVAAWGGACGVAAVLWLIHSLLRAQRFSFGQGRLRADWRASWSLGGWLLAGHVTGICQAYALHWLLAVLLEVEATGDFAAMATLVALANPLVIGLGNFLMPATAHAFAAKGAAGVWRLALRATAWLAAALAIFCLLAAFAGDLAMSLLYGARFAGHTAAFTLLAIAATAAALGTAAEHALRTMDRPRSVFIANLLALITTLALAAWLLPRYGLTGAAGSLLAGNSIGCAARWRAFAGVLNFRFSIFDCSVSPNPKTEDRNGGPE